uniref:uncharacterized protein LOC123461549 n=1 Tax=Jaculus jaculus TaxID=51337 RepID=UPI001E1B5482|nr:uncharacterized protein LOC123461549 [Jaculus jaculus]
MPARRPRKSGERRSDSAAPGGGMDGWMEGWTGGRMDASGLVLRASRGAHPNPWQLRGALGEEWDSEEVESCDRGGGTRRSRALGPLLLAGSAPPWPEAPPPPARLPPPPPPCSPWCSLGKAPGTRTPVGRWPEGRAGPCAPGGGELEERCPAAPRTQVSVSPAKGCQAWVCTAGETAGDPGRENRFGEGSGLRCQRDNRRALARARDAGDEMGRRVCRRAFPGEVAPLGLCYRRPPSQWISVAGEQRFRRKVKRKGGGTGLDGRHPTR